MVTQEVCLEVDVSGAYPSNVLGDKKTVAV